MNTKELGYLVEAKIVLKRLGTDSTIALDQSFIFNFPINLGTNADWRFLGKTANDHFAETMPGWEIVDVEATSVER